MRSLRVALLWLCSCLAVFGQEGGPTYTNPVLEGGGADPAVLFHEGVYYAYTTNSARTVYTSTDLINWTQGPEILPPELKGAWAPEVYHHPEDGKFYLYYTNRYKIGVAVADRPDAMFTDLGFLVIPAIDAHPFRDDDGRLYLYFTHTPDFTMYCVPMRTPIEPGGPVVKCFEVSADWERLSHPINEGPWMLKQDGTYYLFYSGADGQSVHYNIGYATAPTPMGPFTKFPGNPVIRNTETIHGPGHGSFTMDKAGRWWHLYHQKTGTEKGWKRFITLDPLDIDRATGEMGGTPTKGTPQPAPTLAAELLWPPEFSPRGAFFYQEQAVTLSSRSPGAVIRYTLDGSEPTASSPEYREAITLNTTATIRARAFKEGQAESAVTEMRFTRTNFVAPTAPALTEFPSGDPPFRVYSSPNPTPPPRPAPKE